MSQNARHVFISKPIYVGGSQWMVSFADLLSLILTFFVMIYSMTDPIEITKPSEIYNSSFNFDEESKNLQVKLASEQDNMNNEYVMDIIKHKITNEDDMKNFAVKIVNDNLTVSSPKDELTPLALKAVYDTISPLSSKTSINANNLVDARAVAYKFHELGMKDNIAYFEDNNLQNKIEIVVYPKFN